MSDIFRYSSMEDHLEILEWTLRVRHLSPTAPDTLGICSVTLQRSHSGIKILSTPKACTIAD